MASSAVVTIKLSIKETQTVLEALREVARTCELYAKSPGGSPGDRYAARARGTMLTSIIEKIEQ